MSLINILKILIFPLNSNFLNKLLRTEQNTSNLLNKTSTFYKLDLKIMIVYSKTVFIFLLIFCIFFLIFPPAFWGRGNTATNFKRFALLLMVTFLNFTYNGKYISVKWWNCLNRFIKCRKRGEGWRAKWAALFSWKTRNMNSARCAIRWNTDYETSWGVWKSKLIVYDKLNTPRKGVEKSTLQRWGLKQNRREAVITYFYLFIPKQ